MTQPPLADVPGQFKHYRLTRQLGQGGMGSVFEGVDERINERVAVKLLHPHLAASDPSFAERFEREAHTAALLRSPYTVHLLDFGEQHGRYFMVMEYIDGQSLADQIREDGPLEPARALWVAGEVARALEEAGARGIVHRDIKPDNILFDASGRVKVADFGIARSVQSSGLTVSGSFVGTPTYAAPEQAQGTADQRSDIYAVGIMLFTMLTGEPPFQGRTPVETMMLHATADLPMQLLGSAPLPAQNVIRRACEKDPLDRYQSAAELAGAIDRARQALQRQSDGSATASPRARPATQPSSPPAPRTQTPASTPGSAGGPNRMLIAGGVGVVAAIAVGAGLFFALAGGGGDDGGGAAASPSPATVTGFGSIPVQIRDNFFVPNALTVAAGSTVTFKLSNTGKVLHSMRIADSNGSFDGPDSVVSTPEIIQGGQTGDLAWKAPSQPGSYKFRCDIHPVEMNGTIEVREGAAGSPSPSPATTTATPTAGQSPTNTALPSVTAPVAAAKLSSGAKARPVAAVNLFESPSGSAKVIRPLTASDRLIVVTNTPASSTFVITEGLVFWRVLLEGTQTVGWAPEVTEDGRTRFLERVDQP